MIKFCKDCKYSVDLEKDYGRLRCTNPIIIANSSWELSAKEPHGSECQGERAKTGWFTKCGRQGKLYEPKSN